MTSARRRKAQLLFSSCIIITVCSTLELAGEPAPPEVVSAAKSGLPLFLKKIPLEDSQSYGFESGDSIGRARLGAPYRLYELTPSALRRFKPGNPVSSLVSPTGMWYFPLVLGDEAKAILVVDNVGGSWQAVSLGQAPLARELNEVTRRWPRERGYDPLLIVNFQSATYFFTVPQESNHNLTAIPLRGAPPAAASRAEERAYESTGELAEMVKLLKPVVEDSVKQPQ